MFEKVTFFVVCEHVCVHVHMHWEVRGQHWLSSTLTLYLIFRVRVSHSI